jgi:hypothetical protein
VILDNSATHKHPKVKVWLARHRRMSSTTPKSCSWLNAVEPLFSRLTRRRLKRGGCRSIVDLQAAINGFLAETNADPDPSCGLRIPIGSWRLSSAGCKR